MSQSGQPQRSLILFMFWIIQILGHSKEEESLVQEALTTVIILKLVLCYKDSCVELNQVRAVLGIERALSKAYYWVRQSRGLVKSLSTDQIIDPIERGRRLYVFSPI